MKKLAFSLLITTSLLCTAGGFQAQAMEDDLTKDGKHLSSGKLSNQPPQKHPGASKDVVQTIMQFVPKKTIGSIAYSHSSLAPIAVNDWKLRKLGLKIEESPVTLEAFITHFKENFDPHLNTQAILGQFGVDQQPYPNITLPTLQNSLLTFWLRNRLDETLKNIKTIQATPYNAGQRRSFAMLHLAYANLQKEDLYRTELWKANLSYANLSYVDLLCVNLSYANLSYANLQGAKMQGAHLKEANLYRANLYRANLTKAELQGAYLQEADLQEANLTGADLEGANLTWALLTNADLSHTNMDGVIFHTKE